MKHAVKNSTTFDERWFQSINLQPHLDSSNYNKTIIFKALYYQSYLAPLLFALVLHCTILKISADPQCKEMLLNCWYLDDGALAGPRNTLSRALNILLANGDPTGLHIKCHVFTAQELSMFPTVPRSAWIARCPHWECWILLLCSIHWVQKEKRVFIYYHFYPNCATHTILRSWASFCKLAHLAWSTLPSSMSESVFRQFDNDVLRCFELSTAIQLTLPADKKATLNLSHGSLGVCCHPLIHACTSYL